MPHPLDDFNEESRRRLLILLTAVSVAVIIVLWVIYLNWSIAGLPQGEYVNDTGVGAILRTGLRIISEKIEAGTANTYVFFFYGSR